MLTIFSAGWHKGQFSMPYLSQYCFAVRRVSGTEQEPSLLGLVIVLDSSYNLYAWNILTKSCFVNILCMLVSIIMAFINTIFIYA